MKYEKITTKSPAHLPKLCRIQNSSRLLAQLHHFPLLFDVLHCRVVPAKASHVTIVVVGPTVAKHCHDTICKYAGSTHLRLSSRHFAISSGVSSLILLVPGAWLCKNDEDQIMFQTSKINHPWEMKREIDGLTFFQWMLTIFS